MVFIQNVDWRPPTTFPQTNVKMGYFNFGLQITQQLVVGTNHMEILIYHLIILMIWAKV